MELQTEKIPAWRIFFANRRLDLIFKYLFLKNHPKYAAHTDFFADCYAEHIRAFNDFSEECPSDGIPKESREEFLRRFLLLRDSIKTNGFDETLSPPLPIDDRLELFDGAHRLSVCAYLDLDVPARRTPAPARHYDYNFFMKKWLDPFYADYAALEYVKLNKSAYIVNLHSAADPAHDDEVEAILNKHGFVFYKKNINLTFDGYVNLKKLSYGFDFFTGSSWIGDARNKFAGAQSHARKSRGGGSLH